MLAACSYLPDQPGVYGLVNLSNFNLYVGSSSVSIRKRCSVHYRQMRSYSHKNWKINRELQRYSLSSFLFFTIELCDSILTLEREQFWIDLTNSVDHGLNVKKIALGSASPPRRYTMTEETKKKLSLALKGRPLSLTAEQRKKRKENWLGRKHSEETKKKQSIAGKARLPRCWTDEQKLAAALRRRGTVHSAETKSKMRLSHLAWRKAKQDELKGQTRK